MLKEGNLKFKEIKKALIEEKKEVLYPADEFLKTEISPAEKLRYKANSEFADAVTNEFNALISGEIDLDSVKEKSEKLMKNLNPKQQFILNEITKDIISGEGVSLEGVSSRGKVESLQDKYKKYGKYQAYKFFCAGVSDEISKKISSNDVKVMPWGAVVVYVKDEETWNALYGSKNDVQGYVRKYIFNRQVDSSVDDYPYINAQFKRTVFVRVDNTSEYAVKEIEEHELFHEMYNNVLSKHESSVYKGVNDDGLFKSFKNESMAYLFSNQWQYRVKDLLPTSNGEGEEAVDSVTALYREINLYKLREKLQYDDPRKYSILSQIPEEDFEHISEEDKFKIQENSISFVREIGYFLREIVRLKYLESDKFEEAKKAVLTAQSFKEMRYKLSEIDKKPLEPSMHLDLENLHKESDLNRAFSYLQNSTDYRLAVKNIDSLLDAIKARKEEIKDSTKEIDKKHTKWIDEELEYYENCKEKIIKVE